MLGSDPEPGVEVKRSLGTQKTEQVKLAIDPEMVVAQTLDMIERVA